MNSTRQSLVATAWVVVAAGAVIVGSGLRDRVDRSESAPEVKMDNLLASRTGGAARAGDEIPAGDFFFSLTEKLKKEYVEPITDEQKLASGAVRGMIGYLGDPKSVFMDKDNFRVFLNARQGKYEGIGADLALQMTTIGKKARRGLQPAATEDADPREEALAAGDDSVSFPRLVVTSVVPGGPADRAGVAAGDIVYSIDNHWLLNGDLAMRFKKAREAYDAKRIPLSELNVLRKEIREKYDRMIFPLRARERLSIGTAGTVRVVWERNGARRSTAIVRGPSQRLGFREAGGHILLPFVAGAAEALKKSIAGRSAVTIDLRNNTLGDFSVMKQCLAALAPAGQYGVLATERNGKSTPFTLGQGNPHPPKVTLITDKTTRGAAEIFALALSSRGLATLSGREPAGDRDVYDIVELPDGSGYTLVTGHYKPSLTRTAATTKIGAQTK